MIHEFIETAADVHGLDVMSVLVGQGLLDLQTEDEYVEACGGKGKRWRGAMVHPDQTWVVKSSIHAGAVAAFGGDGIPRNDAERAVYEEMKAKLMDNFRSRMPPGMMGGPGASGGPGCPQS